MKYRQNIVSTENTNSYRSKKKKETTKNKNKTALKLLEK